MLIKNIIQKILLKIKFTENTQFFHKKWLLPLFLILKIVYNFL